MSDEHFVFGPWAGMGRRPKPLHIRRRNSYRRCWFWGAAIILWATAFYLWMPK